MRILNLVFCAYVQCKLVGTGVTAARRWRGSKEITHVQGQGSPSKMVGSEVVAAQCWSDCEEILYIQEQRRSPRKMAGGVKSRLESNPIPTRNAQKAQANLWTAGPRGSTETEIELCLSVS